MSKSEQLKKRRLLVTGSPDKVIITGSNLSVDHHKKDHIQEKQIEKLEVPVSSKRSANTTMQLFLISALMVILMVPMVVIIISLMVGYKDTVVTQAFSLFSNLAGIVVGGFLGRLTGENPIKKTDEK